MMPKPKKKSREEILEDKRKKERERYARIKSDPIKLAAYKQKDRQKYLKERDSGVRKTINEMTEREKRQCRKSWRARSAKYYKKKNDAKNASEVFMRANTPSSLCDEALPTLPIQSPRIDTIQDLHTAQSPRLAIARQKSIIQRRKRNKEIKDKDKQIQELKSKLNKYRKKVSKLKKQKENLKITLTPNSKMTQMAENPVTRAEVVKKAIFGDIIEEQISENLTSLKSKPERELAQKLLMGDVVKQRKVWKTDNKVVSYKKVWSNDKKIKTKKNKLSKQQRLAKIVQNFLEDDTYSRLGAGKKEYITRKKIRKQKRYRSDTLRNLYKEFLKTGKAVISYSMFARLTPFWIVAPKVTDRDTCMCTLHSNIQFIVTAINKAKVLEVSSYQNLLSAVCCDRYNECCLERTCDNCCVKSIPLCKDYNEAIPVKYQQWNATREIITDSKTKKERLVTKQKKITMESSAKNLVQKLKIDLDKLFKHEQNIVHQYQTLKMLKESLTDNDAVVHMDFSENYCCKYGEEIQSFHFGGSRMQISLHTVVVYMKNSTRSYCTASTNLFHNVNAIWAHLRPVLDELPKNIENIHFLSDGPVTQYRNKYMFYVLACKIFEMWPQLMHWTWNYHEAGHGKGAPDGVGATCKRTADHIVATGGDISNLTQFCGAIQDRCPNITLFTVTDTEIEEMEKFISKDQPELSSFKGTFKVHQVQGNAYFPMKVVMKSLSCFCSNVCEHFRMGVIEFSTVKANVDDIFSESDAGSTSILKSPDMTDFTSDLNLNIDDTDGLLDISSLDMASLDIHSLELFPEKEKRRRGAKRKIDENDMSTEEYQIGKDITKKSGKKKTVQQKPNKPIIKQSKSSVSTRKKKEKWDKDEHDDCSCIVCGILYNEDTTGQDWIQCVICRNWAQINCIKTDPTSFTCSECLPDGDYKP